MTMKFAFKSVTVWLLHKQQNINICESSLVCKNLPITKLMFLKSLLLCWWYGEFHRVGFVNNDWGVELLQLSL